MSDDQAAIPASSVEDAARVALAFDDRPAVEATLRTLVAMREGFPWKVAVSDLDAAIVVVRRLLGLPR